MKLEKITLTLSVTAILLTLAHEGVAATRVSTITSLPRTTQLQQTKNSAGKKVAKKTSIQKAPLLLAQNSKTQNAPTRNAVKKKKRLSQYEREELAIENEMNAFEMAAIENPLREERIRPTMTSSRTTIEKTADTSASVFSGNVNFVIGQDTNIDPDKTTNFKGTFYQIDPTLSYKSGNWNGSFGASIKDFSDNVNSELFKTNEAKANIGLTVALSNITKSTTTFDFLYHDERWPDYINGEIDINGNYVSMPIRYSNFSLKQSLDFKFDNMSSQIGGSATHRDYYNGYTDYADVTFAVDPNGSGDLKHERDYNELSLFGKITLNAASFLDLSATPSVAQRKFTEREGRLPNGSAGGEMANAPLYELITSQIAFDVAFKFGESNITPTAVVGQVSDEAFGAEDNSFVGVGLNSTLVIDQNSKLTLTPNVMYKTISYENWTAGVVPANEKREETETTAGVNASVMVAKNLGLSLGYNIIREKSNIESDSSENYRQEIVTSGLNFTF